MGCCRSSQLVRRLGKRHIHAALAQALALQKELQRERRLAGAGRALDQVEAVARQAAGEDGIEASNAHQSPVFAFRIGGRRAR